MARRYFTPKTFKFLKDLAANNDRDWFKANQERYEEHVREPALDFIVDFEPQLHAISPHFLADARKAGGSLFRIHRDTRFSKDKSPYKKNTGVHFRHRQGKDVHCPGYYLHVEPGSVFMGVGVWHPDTATARQIRRAIVDDPAAWKKATGSKRFRDTWDFAGDSLKRPPRGFEADHPQIEDIKRTDFIAVTRLTQKTVTSSSFLKAFTALSRGATPLMSFLCDAVGVPF